MVAIGLSSASGLLATSPCADKGCRAWYPSPLGSSCIFLRRCGLDIHTKAESSTFWGTVGKGYSRLSSLSQQRCHLSTLILICLNVQNGLRWKERAPRTITDCPLNLDCRQSFGISCSQPLCEMSRTPGPHQGVSSLPTIVEFHGEKGWCSTSWFWSWLFLDLPKLKTNLAPGCKSGSYHILISIFKSWRWFTHYNCYLLKRVNFHKQNWHFQHILLLFSIMFGQACWQCGELEATRGDFLSRAHAPIYLFTGLFAFSNNQNWGRLSRC